MKTFMRSEDIYKSLLMLLLCVIAAFSIQSAPVAPSTQQTAFFHLYDAGNERILNIRVAAETLTSSIGLNDNANPQKVKSKGVSYILNHLQLRTNRRAVQLNFRSVERKGNFYVFRFRAFIPSRAEHPIHVNNECFLSINGQNNVFTTALNNRKRNSFRMSSNKTVIVIS